MPLSLLQVLRRKLSPTLNSAAFLILFVFAGCLKKERNYVKLKVLALNPQEYTGQKVALQGVVLKVGPQSAYFLMEDDSGVSFVSTERIAQRVECQKGAQIALEGYLESRGEQQYFSMDRMFDCH